MANRQLGEFSFKSGSQTYTLVMDMDAMAACEEHFSLPGHDVFFPEIADKVQRGSAKYARVFFWKALKRHHPEVTFEDVNQIVQSGGGYFGVFGQIAAQLTATLSPDAKDLEALGIDPNPPTAQGKRETARRRRGTGTVSTGTRGASV